MSETKTQYIPRITSREDLHMYLHAALKLEHATIPPYLTALYTIKPGTNIEAVEIIRSVMVEEMLHMVLVANVLNAVGGTPDIDRADFVPVYPTYLPDGETDFKVGLRAFSVEAIDTFLKIERPADSEETAHKIRRNSSAPFELLKGLPRSEEEKVQGMHYYSIGEFYEEIVHGLEYLANEMGEDKLFCGDPRRQVGKEFYYNGGGEIITVKDLDTARAALNEIAVQGEGYPHQVDSVGKEIAHYYRFKEIQVGRYYQPGDDPDHPTGSQFEVDWEQTYNILRNAKTADYPKGSELRKKSHEFNVTYTKLLGELQLALSGEPERLQRAVGGMFQLKYKALELMKNEIPNRPGIHAAPTFEYVNLEILDLL